MTPEILIYFRCYSNVGYIFPNPYYGYQDISIGSGCISVIR